MLVDIGSRYINTDHIISIEPSASGCTATLTNGKTVHIPIGSLAIKDLCGKIVSAPPGIALVEAFLPSKSEDDRTVHYRTSAVIAFRVTDGDVAPIPIGAFGEPRTSPEYEYAVVHPNGQCFGWEQYWGSLEAFKAEQQAVADARREATRPTAGAKPIEPQPQSVRAADRDRYEQAKTQPSTPETIEQLCACILAEPIQSLKPDALWQPGRTSSEVIADVHKANPQLHYAGLGHDPKWGWKWKPGDLERHRDLMTGDEQVDEFERALRFLSYAGQRFSQTKVNRKSTSYFWKHVAERVTGAYVSNGMLIAAAYALGFTVAPNDSPNPCINLGEKAAFLDPDRGL